MHTRGPALRRSRRLLAVAALAGVLLSACSGADDSAIDDAVDPAPASSSPTPTSTPSASPTATAGPDAELPDDGIVVGTSVADGPDEQQLADLVVDYWSQVYQMYAAAEVDRSAFSLVARGAAFQGPVDYVDVLRSNDLRQQGGAVMHVQRIDVDGRSAEIVSCFRNQALNMTSEGRPAEQLLPFFVVRNVLTQQGPDWRVSRSVTVSENQRCDS